MKNTFLIFALFLLVVLSVAPQAHATIQLVLSTHSSDGNDPIDPSLLDATLDFSVVDSQLTLAVTNLTPENEGDPALKINEIYFNTAGNVTGLDMNDVLGANNNQWALSFAPDSIQVDGFGSFDASIIDGQGNLPHVIDPGETITFIIDITGTGPFSDADFIELSAQVDSHIISYTAAKFYDGGDISSFGATNVPEPTTIGLLGFGALALLRKYKRKEKSITF